MKKFYVVTAEWNDAIVCICPTLSEAKKIARKTIIDYNNDLKWILNNLPHSINKYITFEKSADSPHMWVVKNNTGINGQYKFLIRKLSKKDIDKTFKL